MVKKLYMFLVFNCSLLVAGDRNPLFCDEILSESESSLLCHEELSSSSSDEESNVSDHLSRQSNEDILVRQQTNEYTKRIHLGTKKTIVRARRRKRTRLKPCFKCYCGRPFYNQKALQQHEQDQDQGLLVACCVGDCVQSYKPKGLNRHMKQVHGWQEIKVLVPVATLTQEENS